MKEHMEMMEKIKRTKPKPKPRIKTKKRIIKVNNEN